MVLNAQSSPGLPPMISFRLQWRPYQQRVLTELEQHLADGRLHVVAAPGSGKTVLGLEVLRRLNKPTLILAPTITIRDQWVQRFTELFLPPEIEHLDWISTDLRNPRPITVATYQALHCACSGEICAELPEAEEESGPQEVQKMEAPAKAEFDLVDALKKARIGTLVVDECHHLRTNWWRSLNKTVEALGNLNIVSLTATPPYDVPTNEWERYRSLCGPVDAEISAPELVLSGHLCPHQDYVYLNHPSPEEQRQVDEFRSEVDAFLQDIHHNEEFIAAIESHPWLNFPQRHVQEILNDPEYFSSLAIFINSVRNRIPEELMEILGVADKALPPLDLQWLEVLLTGRLFKDADNIGEWDPMLKLIRERLSRMGAIHHRKVFLSSTPKLDRMLISSANKLNSIAEIVRFEHEALGADLRMVVLTDYIRASEMPDSPQDEKPLKRMGVVPIFEKIRRECPGEVRLGILSGSMVVVPKSSEQMLRQICEEYGMDNAQVYLTPFFHDSRYCRLVINDDLRSTVQVVTKLFTEGGITCLVGTKALLGEGWDAPCVNSLILASFVGSYMLSNQMRGRAIRSQPGNPDKTANVWHLVCVGDDRSDPGADLQTLTRRFKAFVGVSFVENVIENGIERLGLGDPPFGTQKIESINEQMRALALDRAGLRRRWEQALDRGGPGRLVDEVKAPEKTLPRLAVRSIYTRAIHWQALTWGWVGACGVLSSLLSAGKFDVFDLLAYGLGLVGIIMVPGTLDAISLARKHGPLEGSLRQIAEAVLEGLVYAGAIKSNPQKLMLTTEKGSLGTALISLQGTTSYESSLFLDAMQEVLNPIQNPRYLIVDKPAWHKSTLPEARAVPTLIGQKKEWATHLLQAWRRNVGYGDLVYTRTVAGRKLLLQAREMDLVMEPEQTADRVSCWK